MRMNHCINNNNHHHLTSENQKEANNDLKCDGQNDEGNEMESVLRALLQCRP